MSDYLIPGYSLTSAENPYARLSGMLKPEPWTRKAACLRTDPDGHFPDKGDNARDAKKVCASCDVREQCLEYALRNNERFGVWGGLSERERARILNGTTTRERA